MIVTQGTATKRGTACQTCQGCESEKSSKEMATESLNPPLQIAQLGVRSPEPLSLLTVGCNPAVTFVFRPHISGG